MTIDPATLLAFNAALQVLFSSVFGFYMLVPMQPWGRGFKPSWLDQRSMLAAHLDWIMLAFMQGLAAGIMIGWPTTQSLLAAVLLVAGGWINPTPYLVRGAGINAFVFGGPLSQRVASFVAGSSSAAIVVAWALIVVSFAPLIFRAA